MRGQIGCKKCAYKNRAIKQTKSLDSFISDAKKVHGNKYDYSKVNYVNAYTLVDIICHEIDNTGKPHGIYHIDPHNHLRGHSCPKCNKTYQPKTNEWIELAKKVHSDYYIYNKTNYITANTKIIVTCPEHGDFTVTPNNHISNRSGCPFCNISKMEREVQDLLMKNNIVFIYNSTQKWLKPLRLDFYLPDYNIAIECQGEQHFYPVGFGMKDKKLIEKQFDRIKKYDSLKLKLCEENDVKLIYYSTLKQYTTFLNEPLYHTPEEILNEINKIRQK